MKQSKLNKEIGAWKIMLACRNNPSLNSFLVIVFMINTVLFELVCLKRLCQYKNTFPAYPVCVSLFMMATCNAYFFRMFFNRISPCFIKTLPFSKDIYTAKLSFLFEGINTLFVLILMIGSFICFGKGYDSSMFYLVIIFYLFVYLTVSIMLPLTAKYFNNENRIEFSNSKGRISMPALNWLGLFVFQIIPLVLISLFANPLAALFGPLTLQGLAIMTAVAAVVVIASCTLNYCMFVRAYKFR